MSTELYPLRLERRLDARIWGGGRLNALLDIEPPVPQLAEAWLVYDTNKVTHGPLAGRTLAEVTQQFGGALVGTRTLARYGADFPLLAKLLDAGAPLSVQVHPDDAYAHSHEAASGFHGKTEAWHFLAAEPGAEITYGLQEASTRGAVARAIAEDRLLDLLQTRKVAIGDTVMVPAGTIHALGAGLTMFEIQQKSDLTYRLYDYGRRDADGTPRALHVEQALAVSDLSGRSLPLPAPLTLRPGHTLLVACPFFALERLEAQESFATATNQGSFEILTCIGGSWRLAWPGGEVPFGMGEALVLPAALGRYDLHPEGQAVLLRCDVPDLEGVLLPALRTAGVSDARIAQTVFSLE